MNEIQQLDWWCLQVLLRKVYGACVANKEEREDHTKLF